MVANEMIQREQEFVNEALAARESRRADRDSGKVSVEGYLRIKGLTLREFISKIRNFGEKD